MTRTEKSPLCGLCKSVAASMGVGRKPAGSLLFLSIHVFIHLISRVLVRATCPHPKGHLSHLSPRFNVENIARNQTPAIPSLCPAERFHLVGSQPHKPHCWGPRAPKPSPHRQTGPQGSRIAESFPQVSVWKPSHLSGKLMMTLVLPRACRIPGAAGSLSVSMPIEGEIESRGSFWSCLLTFFLAWSLVSLYLGVSFIYPCTKKKEEKKKKESKKEGASLSQAWNVLGA